MPEINKIRDVRLETMCGIKSTLPKNGRYEVAFAGRSNVGKSSLINTLLLRKSLARTSSQPGKTQTINYYRVNEGETREDFAPDCYLVDLPGYGYANASPAVKAAWGKMIERYLDTSPMLKCVFLLVDMRHAPTAGDRQMYEWITSRNMRPVIIATKRDKLKPSEVDKALAVIKKTFSKGDPMIIPFSSVTRLGRDAAWDVIREAEGF